MSSHFTLNEKELIDWKKFIVHLISLSRITNDKYVCCLVFTQLYELTCAIYSQDKTVFKPSYVLEKISKKYEKTLTALLFLRNNTVHRPVSVKTSLDGLLYNCINDSLLPDFITEVIEPDESCLYSELMLFINDVRTRYEVVL